MSEGAALSEDEREALWSGLLDSSRQDGLETAVLHILAARAGAADPLRQAVEALADRYADDQAPQGTLWRDVVVADLRRVLDDNAPEAGS